MTFAPDESDIRRIYETDKATFAEARIELELKYGSTLQPTQNFNRRLVSFQANKDVKLHRWFKFKEAFSAQLVHRLIESFDLHPPYHILDPFSGASTTLLVANELDCDAMPQVLKYCRSATLCGRQSRNLDRS